VIQEVKQGLYSLYSTVVSQNDGVVAVEVETLSLMILILQMEMRVGRASDCVGVEEEAVISNSTFD